MRGSWVSWGVVVCAVVVIGTGLRVGRAQSVGDQGASGVLAPSLVLRTEGQPPRDLTVGPDSTIFVFDYRDYVIQKYDRAGRLLQSFGGTGTEPGKFSHLTAIRVVGDRLMAVDSTGLTTFSLDGRVLNRQAYPAEVVPERPIVLRNGGFVGPLIVASELKMVLTLRSPGGAEVARLADHDLRQFFPSLRPGEDFFLQDTYARTYLVALTPEDEILWAASDSFAVHRRDAGTAKPIVSGQYTPVPVPEGLREKLRARQAKAKPPFHVYVPERYPLVQHLLTGPDGDIWVYVKSQEKTGFLRFSRQGREKGFYGVQAGFEVMDAVVRIVGDRLYFIEGRNIHAVALPR